jgi:hypothetical protein
MLFDNLTKSLKRLVEARFEGRRDASIAGGMRSALAEWIVERMSQFRALESQWKQVAMVADSESHAHAGAPLLSRAVTAPNVGLGSLSLSPRSSQVAGAAASPAATQQMNSKAPPTGSLDTNPFSSAQSTNPFGEEGADHPPSDAPFDAVYERHSAGRKTVVASTSSAPGTLRPTHRSSKSSSAILLEEAGSSASSSDESDRTLPASRSLEETGRSLFNRARTSIIGCAVLFLFSACSVLIFDF